MTRLVGIGVLVAGLTAGAVGHAVLAGAPTPAIGAAPAIDRADRAAPASACTAALAPADRAALRGDLARLLDERLAAQPAAQPPPPEEPRPEAVAAAAAAGQLVDAAVARKTWQDADRQAFRAALIAMTTAQRSAALSQLLTALNDGRLRATARPILSTTGAISQILRATHS